MCLKSTSGLWSGWSRQIMLKPLRDVIGRRFIKPKQGNKHRIESPFGKWKYAFLVSSKRFACRSSPGHTRTLADGRSCRPTSKCSLTHTHTHTDGGIWGVIPCKMTLPLCRLEGWNPRDNAAFWLTGWTTSLGGCLRIWGARPWRSWPSETAGCLSEPKASRIRVPLSRYVTINANPRPWGLITSSFWGDPHAPAVKGLKM